MIAKGSFLLKRATKSGCRIIRWVRVRMPDGNSGPVALNLIAGEVVSIRLPVQASVAGFFGILIAGTTLWEENLSG